MKKFLLAIALYCAIQINQHEAISTPPPGPTTISYQGVLTDGSDELVTDGEHSVVFKLYDVTSGGTALWTETQTVTTTNGLFNVDLGSITGVTGVDFTKQLYLEVTVESNVLTPRIKFTAQPYAFMAKSLTETLPVAKGGTGTTSIETFRTNLQLGSMSMEDGIYDELWTGDPLSVAHGGTGATSEAGARTALGLGDLAQEDFISDDLWSGAPLSVSHGGTGVETLEDLKLALDLGSMSSQSADAVEIAGGTGAFSDLSSTNDASFNGVKVGKGADGVATNTALGNNTLVNNTSGANNLAVGQNALTANTTGTGNSGIGRNTLNLNTTGSENTAVGRNALNKNTTASFNTAAGAFALRENTTGTNNTAVGTYSEQFNTTGNNNASLGFQSLYQNTTGSGNTAVGFTASSSNTTGSENTAVGIAAMEKNTTGNRNTALGHQALYGDGGSTGSNNTAVGSSALYKNTTGEGNIAIGYQAGFGNNEENGWSVSDNYATFIGFQASRDLALANTTSLNNVTAIGKNAQVGTDNSIVLGGTGVDAVNVGIGTKSPSAALDISVVAGRQGALITKQSGNTSAGLEINTLSGATGTTLKVSQASTDNGAEIEYNGAGELGSALYITVKNEEQSNNTEARGIYISNDLHGDNAKGIALDMFGNGDNAKGIDIYMEGTGIEQKGIYIDLASNYDFSLEDNRMGAAIGINDGIGLMVANTSSDPANTVKLATNNNALEIVGSSSITGAITLEEESPLITSSGTGEFLISSNGSLSLESANDNDITIAPGAGGNLVIPNGAGAGKVLTSDATGNATWADAASGGSGGGGGAEVVSNSTFSGTSNGSAYVTAKTITVPSTGKYLINSLFTIAYGSGEGGFDYTMRLKQGSTVLSGATFLSSNQTTYGKLDDVIELTSTDNLTLELWTNEKSKSFTGNVKLTKLTAPGGGSSGTTAVPTVLQEIFTNENISLPASGSFVTEKTYTVTGAKPGDAVIVNVEGVPAVTNPWSATNYFITSPYVSANDTIKVRFSNVGAGDGTLTGVKVVVTVIRPIAE